MNKKNPILNREGGILMIAIMAFACISIGFYYKSQTAFDSAKIIQSEKKSLLKDSLHENVKAEFLMRSDDYVSGQNPNGSIDIGLLNLLRSRIAIPQGMSIENVVLKSTPYSKKNMTTHLMETPSPNVYKVEIHIHYKTDTAIGAKETVEILYYIGKQSNVTGRMAYITTPGSPLSLALYWRAWCAMQGDDAFPNPCSVQQTLNTVAYHMCVVVIGTSFCVNQCAVAGPERPDECDHAIERSPPGGYDAYSAYLAAIGSGP